ncbi:MAG: hypothetical protein ACK40X_00480 [Armatimonadota bacterium]
MDFGFVKAVRDPSLFLSLPLTEFQWHTPTPFSPSRFQLVEEDAVGHNHDRGFDRQND